MSAAPETSPDPLPPLARPLRILVADDGRIDRRIVSAILERRGHTVVAVDDGEKAVARLKEANEAQVAFDVAVLDLHMPGMDGSEVVTWIRAHEESRETVGNDNRLLLVALSGAASESEAWSGREVDRFLSKPVDPLLLTATVEGWDPSLAAAVVAEASPERVVFDLGEALARARGKQPLLAELVQIFLEDASVQMESLRVAIAAGDFDRIERASHRLRGSALNVSAQRVADVAEKVERQIRAGQASAAIGLWSALEAEVGGARKALVGFLAQNGSASSGSPS